MKHLIPIAITIALAVTACQHKPEAKPVKPVGYCSHAGHYTQECLDDLQSQVDWNRQVEYGR